MIEKEKAAERPTPAKRTHATYPLAVKVEPVYLIDGILCRRFSASKYGDTEHTVRLVAVLEGRSRPSVAEFVAM